MIIYLYFFLIVQSLYGMQKTEKLYTVSYKANPKFFVQHYIRARKIKELHTFLENEEVLNELKKEEKSWILTETKDPAILSIFLEKGIFDVSPYLATPIHDKKAPKEIVSSLPRPLEFNNFKQSERKRKRKELKKYLKKDEFFEFLWNVRYFFDNTLLTYLEENSVTDFMKKEKCLFPLALEHVKDPLKLKSLVDHGINLDYQYSQTLFHKVAKKPWLYHYDFLYALIARYIQNNRLAYKEEVADQLRKANEKKLTAYDLARQTYKTFQKKLSPNGKINLKISNYLEKRDIDQHKAFTEILEKKYRKIRSHNKMKTKYTNNEEFLDCNCVYPWRSRKKALYLLIPETWNNNQELFEQIQKYSK